MNIQSPQLTRRQIKKRIEELGEWFQNMNLRGVPTAPNHYLGDYPSIKWRHLPGPSPPTSQVGPSWTSGAMPVFTP